MSEFDIRQIKLGEDVTAEAIHEDLEFLDDWEERYRYICLLYTSPSPRDRQKSRMPSSA